MEDKSDGKTEEKTSQSPLRNRNTSMLVLFLAPATLLYLMVFLYPSVRTVVMSFFKVEGVTDPVSSWQFNAGKNYIDAFNDTLFRSAMTNLGKLWLIGGVAVMLLALLYAVALTSGLRAKSFFRSVIYLPNLVSAVAMGTMWLYYAFSKEDYGLMNTILSWFGVDNVMWTDPAHKFWSMLIAYCFGMVGYHMLIFMSGIERIGNDFYEAATIEGANVFQKFFYITLPLLRGSICTNLVMWLHLGPGLRPGQPVLPDGHAAELHVRTGVRFVQRGAGRAQFRHRCGHRCDDGGHRGAGVRLDQFHRQERRRRAVRGGAKHG